MSFTLPGRMIALMGESGAGKTTQAGEYAKYIRKVRGKRTRYFGLDRGGHDSILPLCRAGIIDAVDLGETDDPWDFIDHATSSADIQPDEGLRIIDSGTALGELLLISCGKMSSEGQEIGGRPAPKFILNKGTDRARRLSSNADSHYGIVQQYVLDQVMRSSWLAAKGIDVLWTFGVHRGEEADQSIILGPKVVGKALTPHLPKHFKYFLRLDSIPQENASSRHVLYTQEKPEFGGMGMSFGNARYPLDAETELPPVIEPASLITFFELVDQAQEEAYQKLLREL